MSDTAIRADSETPLDSATLLIVNVHTRRYPNGTYRCMGSTVEPDGGTFDLVHWSRDWRAAVDAVEIDIRATFAAIRPHYTVRFVFHSGDDEHREEIDA